MVTVVVVDVAAVVAASAGDDAPAVGRDPATPPDLALDLCKSAQQSFLRITVSPARMVGLVMKLRIVLFRGTPVSSECICATMGKSIL